ncbi:MAG: ferritin-like domain-containing protein [Solirubrobacteraceae bacterium]
MTDHPGSADDGATTGVVEMLARDDVERKRFLKMAGKRMGAGAAATGLAAFIAACGSSSSKSSTASTAKAAPAGTTSSSTTSSATAAASSGDLAIVNYALTLEYLESQFYAKVISSGLFKGAVLSVIKTFGAEEDQHVAALKKVAMSLGTPAAKPTGKFPIKSATQVATLAATVENLGAAAYLGQAPLIKSKEILAAALAIHSIEARHAATLNLLTKKNPTPNGAFAEPATMAQVLAAVKPFIA